MWFLTQESKGKLYCNKSYYWIWILKTMSSLHADEWETKIFIVQNSPECWSSDVIISVSVSVSTSADSDAILVISVTWKSLPLIWLVVMWWLSSVPLLELSVTWRRVSVSWLVVSDTWMSSSVPWLAASWWCESMLPMVSVGRVKLALSSSKIKIKFLKPFLSQLSKNKFRDA